MKPILFLLSLIYGSITWLRNILFNCGILSSYKSSLPVISIGNITVGGTGKTPICILLAEELKCRGFSPVILSRGYGGSQAGPYKVSLSDSYKICGDEPLLMAKRNICPVVVSRKRVLGAILIESQKLGNVIILDDGFQHRRLKRDLDIVLIDVSTPQAINQILSGAILPFGRLREPRAEALNRSDIFILNERKNATVIKEPSSELLDLLGSSKKVFLSVYMLEKPYAATNGEELAPCDVVAFCGIANPEGFFESLNSLGFRIIAKEKFSDHYNFKFSDIEKLRLRHPHMPLVCTEKDAIRLTPEISDMVYILKVRAKVVPEEPFIEYVTSTLQR